MQQPRTLAARARRALRSGLGVRMGSRRPPPARADPRPRRVPGGPDAARPVPACREGPRDRGVRRGPTGGLGRRRPGTRGAGLGARTQRTDPAPRHRPPAGTAAGRRRHAAALGRSCDQAGARADGSLGQRWSGNSARRARTWPVGTTATGAAPGWWGASIERATSPVIAAGPVSGSAARRSDSLENDRSSAGAARLAGTNRRSKPTPGAVTFHRRLGRQAPSPANRRWNRPTMRSLSTAGSPGNHAAHHSACYRGPACRGAEFLES